MGKKYRFQELKPPQKDNFELYSPENVDTIQNLARNISKIMYAIKWCIIYDFISYHWPSYITIKFV